MPPLGSAEPTYGLGCSSQTGLKTTTSGIYVYREHIENERKLGQSFTVAGEFVQLLRSSYTTLA